MHFSLKTILQLAYITTIFFTVTPLHATKLTEVGVIDKDYLMVHFLDGEVTFRDDGKGPGAFLAREHQDDIDTVKKYGTALSTSNAVTAANWVLKSEQDANYGSAGKNPTNCYRKSKLNGMAEREWGNGDYNYEYTMEHFIFLKLPSSLVQGNVYTLEINASTNSDQPSANITFDIYKCRSEALHINLVGYAASSPSKAADLYCWMGDGGARDYKSFEGKDVFVYNVNTEATQKAGTVAFWKKNAGEAQGYELIKSSVWNADFPGFTQAGKYRIAIDGVGCSQDFVLSDDVYYDPFKVSVLGFFYMRIGQDSTGGMRPVPRRPLWIPGTSPKSTKVYLTALQPFHPNWKSLADQGDVWDRPADWASFRNSGNPTNPNAWGGHSDALDWDRHLGHIPIIYDMLLPFILTKGAISDDDLGIAESGNGIPDILDEARYEVDFWLRLRDGKAYSHGLTNPKDSVFYQAGTTAIAAWANALNCAMLADCFRITGKTDLMNEYRDSAIAAYEYAGKLSDPMLDSTFGIGNVTIRGRDLKMSTAAFLYNCIGEKKYEDVIKTESKATDATSALDDDGKFNQLWGTAGYLLTPQTVHYTELAANMKASVINEAKNKEADYSGTRPSRRSSDNNLGWFQTEQNVHRTIIAHSVTDNQSDKESFFKALTLEADWGLGRNPLNIIQMTTASTSLESKRSVENIYTTGYDDGTPGMHPGHTPYLNMEDWGGSMVMGRPSWLGEKGYPADFGTWPKAEAYFNTRYVYAHSEFTPQQTMRGKTALYGYLYGIGARHSGIVRRAEWKQSGGRPSVVKLTIGTAAVQVPAGENCSIRLLDLSGRVVWSGVRSLTTHTVLPAAVSGRSGVVLLEIGGMAGRKVGLPMLLLK